MSAESAKGMNTGRIISILVGVALVSALGFFIYKYYDEKGKGEQQISTIDEMKVEIFDLETNISDYQSDLENQDLDIEEKERLLAEKEQLLIEKQKRIDQLVRTNKLSAKEVGELKGKMQQLQYYVKKYQTEISDLRLQLDNVIDEKNNLTAEVSEMKGQVHNLTRVTEEKDFKLKSASVLNAHTFKFFRIKGSGKTVQETSFRRGQMDNVKFCWKINQNLAAEAGPREIFVQLIDPTGNVVKSAATSGYFKADDTDKPYTLKKDIEYDRTTQEVCVEFAEPDGYEYAKGVHKVIVWIDGFDIGKGSFEVK